LRRNPFIVSATIKLQFHNRQVVFPQTTQIKAAQISGNFLRKFAKTSAQSAGNLYSQLGAFASLRETLHNRRINQKNVANFWLLIFAFQEIFYE
jgi:hypothetical protein